MLFIGDIIESNDDHTGTFSQLALERVRVVKIFKGLPEGTQEVWVNPGSGTSCYGELPAGKRYLIDGADVGKLIPEIANQSRNYRGERKPLPAGFDPTSALVVSMAMCGRSALATPENQDVQFLEAYKGRYWQPRVSGVVDQLDWLSRLFQPHLPVAQARIHLSGPGGERETVTDSNGSFEFPGIQPGQYEITFEKAGFTVGGAQQVKVPVRGCGWWAAIAKTNGRMRIRVTTKAGTPLKHVPVTLMYEAEGKLNPYKRDVETNESGVANFFGLPAATYVTSVNPQGPHRARAPYPATFYPGVPDAAKAERISLGPDEQKLGYALVLPEAVPVRHVAVRVLNQSGEPEAGATVFTGSSSVEHTDANGRVLLSTLSGQDETITAWQEFDTEEGRKPWIDWKRWVAKAKLPGKSGDAKIEVRFETWVRNGDQ